MPLRILYAGPDYPGSNGACWRDAFVELGHEVRTVDSEQLIPSPRTLLGMAHHKLFGRPSSHEVALLNDSIVREACAFRPDCTFYVQARNILPVTLEVTARYGPNVGYFNDDMFNPRNQYFTFFEAIKRIDCILTTKSYNVPEFHTAGAPLAIYIPNAYDPKNHFPARPLPSEQSYYQGDVAFIGTFRPERADFLASVTNVLGDIRLNVWGGGWHKMDRPNFILSWRRWKRVRRQVKFKELWCAEMGKAITSNKICLGLLYHANRDLHTSRSFEIPACQGFMLAERTDEHRTYFTEDKEAVYFSSKHELLEKIRYYLTHPAERQRIAEAGYQRCLRSPYRYVDRALFAIEQIHRLRPNFFSVTPESSDSSHFDGNYGKMASGMPSDGS